LAIGVRIKIVDTDFRTSFQVTHAVFPVRIGRHPLNDVQLSKPHVSEFHAVIEEHDGRLMLRDLGSRNGTMVRDGRAPAHELVDLEKAGFQFQISTLGFQVALEEVDPDRIVEQQAKRGAWTAEPQVRPHRSTRYEESLAGIAAELLAKEAAEMAEGPTELRPVGVDDDLERFIDAVKLSSHELVQALEARGAELSPEQQGALLLWARDTLPSLEKDAGFSRLLRRSLPPDGDPAGRRRLLEYVALQAVTELAHHYVPEQPEIQREEDVLQFLSKLREVLDAFLSSFILLRDGCESFRTEMDLKQRRERVWSQYDTAKLVKTAGSPSTLAARLLDWRSEAPGARKAIEGVFADVMIHQIAVLRGVVRGVQSIVEEISPARIEAEVPTKGVFSGMFRFKELWKIYCARHGDLQDGEKRIFGLVFGPEFAKAYGKMSRDAAEAG
jgi:type VI secretion system protein ImpI